MTNKNAWSLADLEKVKKNNVKVFSTFSAGGGSCMGYKLAGCEVVAANDIDKRMKEHYLENLTVKHFFENPIGELLDMELPKELYGIDILDGSPPCSTFSIIGHREKTWGKLKHFKEGQAKQVLSDLFFDYLDLVDKVQPKVAIAENVKGMLAGNAKGYTREVIEKFKDIGYIPQLFLVNAADCGVPQYRERVFFCAIREDLYREPLKMKMNETHVSFYQATNDLELTEEEKLWVYKMPASTKKLYSFVTPGRTFDFQKRNKDFSKKRIARDKPMNTITANSLGNLLHWEECRYLTLPEVIRCTSFPDDYKMRSLRYGLYVCGMSVPPKMMKCVAQNVINQWLK